MNPFSWDSEHWGKPGHNVHESASDDLGDHGRHSDETGDQ